MLFLKYQRKELVSDSVLQNTAQKNLAVRVFGLFSVRFKQPEKQSSRFSIWFTENRNFRFTDNTKPKIADKLTNSISIKITFEISPFQGRARSLLNNPDECLGRFTPDEYDALINLWPDPGIQEAYKHRGEYNLNDSAK